MDDKYLEQVTARNADAAKKRRDAATARMIDEEVRKSRCNAAICQVWRQAATVCTFAGGAFFAGVIRAAVENDLSAFWALLPLGILALAAAVAADRRGHR